MHGRKKHLVFHFIAFASVDLFVAATAAVLASLVPLGRRTPISWSSLGAVDVRPGTIALAVGCCVAWHVVFRTHGLYRSWRMGIIVAEWWEIARATFVGTLIFSGLAAFFVQIVVTRSFLLTFWA